MKITKEGIAVIEGDTHVSKWVEESGRLCHDANVVDLIGPLLHTNFWAIDAGANIGDHTVFYSQCVGPAGRVIAFEPHPLAYECLLYNVEQRSNILPLKVALGHQDSGAFFTRHSGNVGASYIDDKGDEPVPTVFLDQLGLTRLDFIKLDIEGYELNALEGAEETLATCRPIIVMEMSGHQARYNYGYPDVFKFLEEKGYAYRPLNPTSKLEDQQYDLLCTPK